MTRSPQVYDLMLFHQKFDMPEEAHPAFLTPQLMKFRLDFLEEEVRETRDAYNERDLAKVADGLVDTVYVAIGTAELMGLPFDALWREVQRANMQKTRAIHESESKRSSVFDVIKPEGWQPPDIERVLAEAMKKENAYDRRQAIVRSRHITVR